jgi:hypothetical protein
MLRPFFPISGLAVALGLLSTTCASSQARTSPFLNTLASSPAIMATTVAANGDQNPYGVAVVPSDFPASSVFHPGDILVSDFNDAANVQATGSSIVEITPAGSTSTVFTAPSSLGSVGLTTALFALRSGLVVVGSAPNAGGTPPTVGNGSLIFLDSTGKIALDLADSSLLRGPWAMIADETAPEDPILYVSEVLTGTVTRIMLHVATSSAGVTPVIESLVQVASGFEARTDPAALVVGPTSLLLSQDMNDLYVADTGNNRVQLVRGVRGTCSDLGAGTTVVSGAPLRGPLGLAWTPEGTIVLSNGDAAGSSATQPNLVVELDPVDHVVLATRQLDTGAAGALFGIAIAEVSGKVALLYADDNTNTLDFLFPKH